MPTTNSDGEPKQRELSGTLQPSGAKAQRTFAETHDSAVDEYGAASGIAVLPW